jgi:hypothetical protein
VDNDYGTPDKGDFMSDGITVQVDENSLNKLTRNLVKAGIEISDLKDAFQELSREAALLAASLAPHKSGVLAASVRGNRAKSSAVVRAGGAKVKYAGVQEWGWPARSIEATHYLQRTSDALKITAPAKLELSIARLLAAKGLS